VYIEGRRQTRRWEDTQGTKHCSIEIVANEMMVLGEPKDINQNSAEIPSPKETVNSYPIDGEK
jgi:single-strand DNA-binding protein